MNPDASDAPRPTARLSVLFIGNSPDEARLFEEHLRKSEISAQLRREPTLAAGLAALMARCSGGKETVNCERCRE